MPSDKDRKQYQQLLEASSIGLMFPLAIAIGYFWGWGMDKLFGTRPWLAIIFSVFGMIAAFINLFRASAGADAGTSGSTQSGAAGSASTDSRTDEHGYDASGPGDDERRD